MNPPPAPVLRLTVAQTAPVLRDAGRNARELADLAHAEAADLLLTPELSLTGYDVGDAVHSLARRCDDVADSFAGVDGQLVVGMIESHPRGPFNTAIVVQSGRVHFRHRKLYLPTYGMFDEGRFFGRGTTLDTFEVAPGWTAGLLICEDFWHPGLLYVLATRGIDLLLVQAAAPGRGVREGGAHGAFASADVWERLARTSAQLYGMYVALANRAGVEGGVTFAGGSLVAGPDGSVIARCADHGCDVARVELSRAALVQSRTPYSHARDEDVSLILRELARSPA